MKERIGIIGKGNVGSALGRGLERAGYEVRLAGSDAAQARAVAAWAEVVVFAMPHGAVGAAVATLGAALDGKVVVDAVNPLTADFGLALGFTTSAGEELQKLAPRARVVKAFNTVFAQVMESGRVRDQQVTAFVAGDDAAAKAVVLAMAGAIGFDAVDAGPLQNARWLEAMAYQIILLAYAMKMGPSMGYHLIH